MNTEASLQVDPVVEGSSRFGAKRLYRDAGSMVTTSVANAALGMVFWALAAKTLPPAQLGVMTAVLSVIVTAAVVIASGVGDAYTALLPAVGAARPAVYRRGQRVFLSMSVITGVAAAVATTTLLAQVRGSIAVAILVAVGTVAWSAFILQNSTLTALGRAHWQPAVNVATSAGKIILLVLLAATAKWQSVEVAFVVAAAVAVFALRPAIVRVVDRGIDLPSTTPMSEDGALREFNRLVIRTLTVVVLSLGVLLVSPFLVVVFAGPSQGALFSLSLSISQTLDFVSSALGVSLVVHGSSSPQLAGLMSRTILMKTAVLTLAGALLITALAPVGLRLINPEYGTMGATGVIGALCAGSVIRTVYLVWAALQLARRNMKAPLVLNLISGVLLLAVIPELARTHGALGGAVAMLLAQSVLCAGVLIHFVTARFRGREKTLWRGTVGPSSGAV